MNRLLRAASVLALTAAALAAHAERVYGITDGIIDPDNGPSSFVSFDSANPDDFTTIGFLSGIASGQRIRAVDFRPSSGTLYALSSSGVEAQLYTVDLATAALTAVGTGFTLPGATTAQVSVDFDPVADVLRVVTGPGANLRVSPVTGAILGIDTNISRPVQISDVAYANNVAGATSTTLYGYGFSNDRIVTIGSIDGTPNSPDSGLLFDVGRSGVSAQSGLIGFDISGATGVGYLSLGPVRNITSDAQFYSVNLGNGRLTQLGSIDVPLIDFSVAPQAVPEPSALAALGLGAVAMLGRRKKA